jgi:hypothetical protein
MSEPTNEELRLSIAQAKGWDKETEVMTSPTRDGQSFQHPHTYWTHPDHPYSIPPDWPIDLNAAWYLVIEAQSEKVGFDLSNTIYFDDGRWEYDFTFYDPIGGPESEQFHGNAGTAPRAICLAYLAWKGIK